ncbi:hypothetical protein ACIA8C_27060 [Nocardia sp. NPDC051321]|uniref:hypothetical protein n=1 Tax=Nocardia sp. NPDC051321 TaxID=3364323 RepID=UPI0037A36A67
MTDDSGGPVFGPLIEQAKSGSLALTADPAAFITLDKACEERKTQIRDIQRVIRKIYEAELWGVGERSDLLTSAQTLVRRFREKAMTGPNNAFDTLEGHYEAASDLQALFQSIRERYEQTDTEFAARFKELKLAQRPEHGGGR